jgi:HEAT repeat protein
MRRIATILMPPIALLMLLALAGPDGAGATAPPPLPEPLEDFVPPVLPDAARSETVNRDPSPTESAPGLDAQFEDPVAANARALVFSISFAAEASTPYFPALEVEEAARLLTRHPEAASVFAEALADAGRSLRGVLLHVFYKVEDRVVQDLLLAAHRASDPVARKLKEILPDRERILDTLRGKSDEEILPDLVGRLGTPLLKDPEVRAELVNLFEHSSSKDLRIRALSRLGAEDDPEVRQLLLGILADPTGDESERGTAARLLVRRPGTDSTAAFVEVLQKGGSATLTRFAALGLKHAGDHPEAVSSLFDLLLSEQADTTARQNAATALGSCLKGLDGPAGASIESRLRSALTDLSAREGSQTVLVHAMGVLTRGQAGRFDDDLAGIIRRKQGQNLRGLLALEPALMRFLEIE